MNAVIYTMLLYAFGIPAANTVIWSTLLLNPPEFALAVVPCGYHLGTTAPWTQTGSLPKRLEIFKQNVQFISTIFERNVLVPPIVQCSQLSPMSFNNDEHMSPLDILELWSFDCFALLEIEESVNDPYPWHCAAAARAPIAFVGRVLDCCSLDETNIDCLLRVRVLHVFRGEIRAGQIVGVWQFNVETREANASSHNVVMFLAPRRSAVSSKEENFREQWAHRYGVDRVLHVPTLGNDAEGDDILVWMNPVRPEWLAVASYPNAVKKFCNAIASKVIDQMDREFKSR